MSKAQHGNKEAKKPKQQPGAVVPSGPTGARPGLPAGALAVASLRSKKGPGGHPTR